MQKNTAREHRFDAKKMQPESIDFDAKKCSQRA